jgi:Rrf2 family protein
MALRLTAAADYAIRAMIHIACIPEGSPAMGHDVARMQGIPHSFMAKILRRLVGGGLLRSTRGAHGGFFLARPATQLNLLEVVEAIEGPLTLTTCSSGPGGCQWAPDCPASAVWHQVQEQMADVLRSSTLESMVCMPRKNGKVAMHTGALRETSSPPSTRMG